MDTTADPDITFDENGICNYVYKYNASVAQRIPPASSMEATLQKTVNEIKARGQSKKYDCIIGVSGGVDSTFIAYQCRKLGLRPLAVHIDNGWNSELSVSNIEKTLKHLDIDLHTEVLNWHEFKDLQLSFLKASVPDGEIPTDHAIYSVLYRTAAKFGVSYVISGTNVRTEGIMPRSWSSGHLDSKYISSVQKKFGTRPLKSFPLLSPADLLYFNLIKRIKQVSLLDMIDYRKDEAIEILKKELNWTPYEGKHYESIYTRFYQGYLLPQKFRMDKRRGHLSALICSGQMTRDEALQQIGSSPYPDPQMLTRDYNYVLKKLHLNQEQFEQIMALPEKRISDYPNNFQVLEKLRALYNKYRKKSFLSGS